MPWMEISPRVFESLQRDTVLNNRLLEVRVNNPFSLFSLKLRWLLHAIGTSFVLKILICIIFRIRIAKKWKVHFISSNTFKSVKHLDKKERQSWFYCCCLSGSLPSLLWISPRWFLCEMRLSTQCLVSNDSPHQAPTTLIDELIN